MRGGGLRCEAATVLSGASFAGDMGVGGAKAGPPALTARMFPGAIVSGKSLAADGLTSQTRVASRVASTSSHVRSAGRALDSASSSAQKAAL
jgi:hypothetical protein